MKFFQLCRALELIDSKKEKKAKQRILRKLFDRVTRDGHHSVLRLLVPQVGSLSFPTTNLFVYVP